MGFFKTAALAATALLATSANCHMVMKTPVPYGKSTLNNSPLDPSGSDFPCKLRPGAFDKEGAENVMAIGESQTLSFTGSAVHGGGSCQIALTTDLEPTKNSKWMVIKSIEGGCPASVAGNLPADPNGSGASTFQYSIPEGISPGSYTLSWSWLNKVGNREYYQNCAPVTVTASKRRRYAPAPKAVKRQASFPDLFVANVGSVNDCVAPENFDFEYPNPGADVQKAGTGPYTMLSCGAGSGNTSPQQPTAVPSGPGSASSGSPGQSGSTFAGPGTGPTSAPSVPGGSPAPLATEQPHENSNTPGGSYPQPTGLPQSSPGSPGVFATGAQPVVVPVTASTEATAPVETGSTTGPEKSSNGSASAQGACTVGDWACSADGSSFQRCISGGTWSTTMSMAAGTACTPGISANLNTAKSKRHAHGHIRRFLRSDSH